MIILAIESSCDETAVALVRDGREVLTDQVFSQADLHAIYGGVVPEIASRSHVEVISQLADRALAVTGLTRGDIDAVAVTCAPGAARRAARRRELCQVRRARARRAAHPGAPCARPHRGQLHRLPGAEAAVRVPGISGGNTLICDVRDYTDLRILGATRDDEAGECFDKTARVLGLPYPGGKPIDDLSKTGDDRKYKLPIGHVDGCPYDMSFRLWSSKLSSPLRTKRAFIRARWPSCTPIKRHLGDLHAPLPPLPPRVGRRYQMAKRRQQTILRSSEDAGNYLVPLYLYERTEVVYLLCLDAKCGLISCKEVGRGVVNAAEVSVLAIVETALSQKAVSVILSHNHVDAYALPSREDELTTRRIRDALLLVGITLADHIIVCGEDYVSFADSGLL